LFEFTVGNPTAGVLTGWLSASLQNCTGWDGVAPIAGNSAAGYGGNVNRERRRGETSSIVMSNAVLPSDDARYGQVVLSTDGPGAHILEQYATLDEYAAFLRGRYLLDHAAGSPPGVPRSAGAGSFGGLRSATGPSPAGATWNGALAVPFRLAPGEERRIRVWITWWFPNRYVDFVQFGNRDDGRSRLWLGAHYATVWPDAIAVGDHVHTFWDGLAERTAQWLDAFRGHPPEAVEHLLAQAALVRSTTCFRAADGAFFGFEGVQGASTGGWADHGGSCPLNCTHVWNYEQAVARLFPVLERSMRDTEFDVMQAPDGSLPHRVLVPTFLRQPWGEPIGGPVEPALDGMLGAFLKTLREVQHGAPAEWLQRRWPALLRLLAHVRGGWEQPSGVLAGAQPSTFDIPLHGVNPYIGSLWLAALRAVEELALLVGDEKTARTARGSFDRASLEYDSVTFTGEYYAQVLAPTDPPDGSWGGGCLADQLVGQWWAHQLGLGYILPADHVRSALSAILRHNLRRGFPSGSGTGRVFAHGDETGLVNCSWPEGGRPENPVWYSDEVWTGVEQQVAASMLFEGLDREAEQILEAMRRRHDGRHRSPFNHIECGDQYARGMAGFSLLEARSGLRVDATRGAVVVAPGARSGRWPLFSGTAWGVVEVAAEIDLSLLSNPRLRADDQREGREVVVSQ
ncbi:MAG TPA: GH116 family glycosyl hydrolase, partial [Naasia sp.]